MERLYIYCSGLSGNRACEVDFQHFHYQRMKYFERTDFGSFTLWKGLVVLKKANFNNFQCDRV